MHEMGSRESERGVSMTFSPFQFVFVQGRVRVCVPMVQVEWVKWEQAGLEVVERSKEDIDRSSPRRHWPQKASNMQAATATSKGLVRSSPLNSCWSMAIVISGRRGFLEEDGARFLAPLMMTCRHRPLFQVAPCLEASEPILDGAR